jgi:hypothetical protein
VTFRIGSLPDELSNKECLPSLIFVNLDGMFNLFTYFFEELKSWVDVVDKIVLDEVHTIFSELSFRNKYKVYFQLPVLGIPILALSGSLPLVCTFKVCQTTLFVSCHGSGRHEDNSWKPHCGKFSQRFQD